MRIAANGGRAEAAPERDIWPFEPPALRSTPPTRPRSFASPARSLARHEHETKPKLISRLGLFPPTSDPGEKIWYMVKVELVD